MQYSLARSLVFKLHKGLPNQSEPKVYLAAACVSFQAPSYMV